MPKVHKWRPKVNYSRCTVSESHVPKKKRKKSSKNLIPTGTVSNTKHVLWSDEFKCKIFGSNCDWSDKTCWRLCHGLRLHLSQWCWWSFQNDQNYECRTVFLDLDTPSPKHLIHNGYIFQQDNDPKHTASTAKWYLDRKKKKPHNRTPRNMDWPPQSPRFNITKAVWESTRKGNELTWHEWHLRNLEIYFFRLPKKIYIWESLPNTVQTVLIFIMVVQTICCLKHSKEICLHIFHFKEI